MMHCSQVRIQLEAYALGILEPDEQRAIEDHLAGCAGCYTEAGALLLTANLLPLGIAIAPTSAPPDELKERVLEAIKAETTAADFSNERPYEIANPAAPHHAGHDHDVPFSSLIPNKSRFLNLKTVVAAAAVILLAVSMALGVRLSQALDREDALRAQVQDVFTRQQEIVLEVVDSNQTQRLVLRPLVEDSSAYGKVFTRSDLPHVVAMAARLPAPPEGMRYHLWLTEQGETELAGVLMLNDLGFGLLTFDADADGPIYERALLTLQEPGSDVPTGGTVLTWPDPNA